MSGFCLEDVDARPGRSRREITSILCRSSTLVSAKMLRMSSSTISTCLPGEQRRPTGAAARSMLPLGFGQVGLDAVEEERRLVEQALRRAHVLDDDRLGQPLELASLPSSSQVLAGVDDDRQRRAGRGCLLDLLDQLEARHVGQPEVEHHAVEVGRPAGPPAPLRRWPRRWCGRRRCRSAPAMLLRWISSSSTTSRFFTRRSHEARAASRRPRRGSPCVDRLLQ